MTESGMVGLSTAIGVYGLANCGAVLVHAIDYSEDRVLAGLNGEPPEWCPLTEEYWECTGELETGFHLGSSLFVPLSEVMRFTGEVNEQDSGIENPAGIGAEAGGI